MACHCVWASEFTRQFAFDLDQQLLMVTAFGRVSLFQYLIEINTNKPNAFAQLIKYLLGPPEDLLFSTEAVYEALVLASGGGHVALMNCLMAMDTERLKQMMISDQYGAFCRAARYEQTAAIARLNAFLPNKVEHMRLEAEYDALAHLAVSKNIESMDEFLTILFKDKSEVWRVSKLAKLFSMYDFSIFRTAVIQGRESVVCYLLQKQAQYGEAEQVRAMLEVAYYNPFRESVARGYLDIMKYLIQTMRQVAPEQLPSMLMANRGEAWRVAQKRQDQPMMDVLLEHPVILANTQSGADTSGNLRMITAQPSATTCVLVETDKKVSQLTRVVSFTQEEDGVELKAPSALSGQSIFAPQSAEAPDALGEVVLRV